MFGRILSVLMAAGGVCLHAGAGAPDLDNRLRALELRQDSILSEVRALREKDDFMAMRMGWKPPNDTAPKEIPVGRSFTRGPSHAALTLVEFSDLQCPYCAQLAPILDSVSKAFPKDLRLVFKHFPLSFHPQARSAAAAAIAAGKQGRFFEFRFRAAAHYRNLGDSLYLALARDLGLDLERFKLDMARGPEIEGMLQEDMELGRKLGVEGTPTVYANGRLTTDRSFDYYARLVAEAKSRR